MLKCRDIQDIVVDEKQMSFSQKIGYKFHLFICKNCCKIKEQYKILDAKVRGIDIPLTEDDKCQIDKIIDSASNK